MNKITSPKNIKFFWLVMLIFFTNLLSYCSEGSNSVTAKYNGPLKLIITNKTDYEVKEIYYKQTDDFNLDNGYGNNLLKDNETLADGASLILCPNFVQDSSEKPYYFTFVRQKGSTDNSFYITTEIPIYLSSVSGIVNIDLLPYNFYSTTTKNTEQHCNDGIQNGE